VGRRRGDQGDGAKRKTEGNRGETVKKVPIGMKRGHKWGWGRTRFQTGPRKKARRGGGPGVEKYRVPKKKL